MIHGGTWICCESDPWLLYSYGATSGTSELCNVHGTFRYRRSHVILAHRERCMSASRPEVFYCLCWANRAGPRTSMTEQVSPPSPAAKVSQSFPSTPHYLTVSLSRTLLNRPGHNNIFQKNLDTREWCQLAAVVGDIRVQIPLHSDTFMPNSCTLPFRFGIYDNFLLIS